MGVDTVPINDAVKRILEVLAAGSGAQTARSLFEMLTTSGFSEEVASRALASGSRNGDFAVNSQLKVSLNGAKR
jgi:hypothetical protein